MAQSKTKRRSKNKRRWVFLVVYFFFLLFHQFDMLVLAPIAALIMTSMNAVEILSDPTIIIGTITGIFFYLIWGYLFDIHNRKKLFSVVGAFWGFSSLLMGIAPTYATFVLSYAAASVDNASHSGIFALVGDFFNPKNRGKILGLLYVSQPLAIFLGLVLNHVMDDTFNWRPVIILVGIVGFLMSLLILFFTKEPKRGASEPALADIKMTGIYVFDWEIANDILRNPGLIFVFGISLFAIVPWFVILLWLFPFLAEVRAVPESAIYLIFLPALIALTLGYPIGGLLGDELFKLKKTGRIIVTMLGVLLPSFFLLVAIQLPDVRGLPFIVIMMFMGFFLSFTWPNLVATIMDVTLPELRSSAIGMMHFFQAIGAFLGPLIVAALQEHIGLGNAILGVCLGAWMVTMVLLTGLLIYVPRDIEQLRRHMAYRSQLEARLAAPDTI